ncbi:hypothetical protein PoB_007564200 [Plakobranchus ocellatus]|uniref:Uncharacterized protein n=1 Tax=Plakobranchus ocellatus TaxID=259542 RepID=A0AAV4DXT5_9GAST|nr:hypothetical protein PoB_007564200 [Plakobranchus ocellatus]
MGRALGSIFPYFAKDGLGAKTKSQATRTIIKGITILVLLEMNQTTGHLDYYKGHNHLGPTGDELNHRALGTVHKSITTGHMDYNAFDTVIKGINISFVLELN